MNEFQNDKYVEEFLKNYGIQTPQRYSYVELKRMSNLFKEKLGHGGYGSVYKGKLSNASLVAIKILGDSSSSREEFINEVATIGRTSHVNVVRLLGFCCNRNKRGLVYEFMPNGSLEKFVLSDKQKGERFSSQMLYDIAIGIEYLHNGCDPHILHFDIKPDNILSDYNFHPKISDFGLARP
ncbi:hypothetical protein AMTRI_Chr13g85150 [Amborella trichopoda]